MNEALGRQRKMRVLLRLRELRQEEAGVEHLQARRELQLRKQQVERQSRRYELAHQPPPARLNPDAHGWRLAAIEQLRAAARSAVTARQEAQQHCTQTQQQLARCKLDTRVAEKAEAAARQAVRQLAQQREQEELLELQLFSRQEVR
jgi:hypothetical protein